MNFQNQYPAYNQPFLPQFQPQQYQQPIQPQYQQPIQQPIEQSEKIYVQGEEGAKAYLVARNEFVRLWDDKEPIFYEKRADASGRPSMEMFRYEKIESASEIEKNEAIRSLEDRVKALESLVRKGARNAKSNADDGTD